MDGRPGRRLRPRPERGAASLAELVVAMALAGLLLGVVVVVAAGTERVASLASSELSAQRSAAQVLASALRAVSDASPLGACEAEDGPVYTTPLPGCADVVQGAPAVEAASSSGATTGLCWYSYPDAATGLVAPDLRCLAAYPDGELWSFDWPPLAGATYTSCDPASCFGTGAPGPGQLPPEPYGPEGFATLAGEVSQPAGAVSFYDQQGDALSLSASSTQAELATVYRVDVRVAEAWGAGPHPSALSSSETYEAVIGQALWQGQQQAPLGAPAPPVAPPPAATTTTATT